jgi:hypothetical protein
MQTFSRPVFPPPGRRPPAPILGERLNHQSLLRLRRKAAERRIAIKIGREGIALGAGRDGVRRLRCSDLLFREQSPQGRKEREAHFQAVDALLSDPKDAACGVAAIKVG